MTFISNCIDSLRSNAIPSDPQEPEGTIEAYQQDQEHQEPSLTVEMEIKPVENLVERHQADGVDIQSHHSEDEYAPSQTAYSRSGVDLGEHHLEPPTRMTPQNIPRDNEKEDAIYQHTEEQGTGASSPPPPVADTMLSGEAGTMSLICSPMDTGNRRHEETLVYTLPHLHPVIDEGTPPYLGFTGPQAPLPDRPTEKALEKGETLAVSSANDLCSSSPVAPKSPDLLGPLLSSPLFHELVSRPSSPVLVPSSPPTSSPPLISSRPSSPLRASDDAITKLTLTELPDMPVSDMQSRSSGHAISRDNLSTVKSGAKMATSDAEFESDVLIQKEQTNVMYHLPPNPKRPTLAAQRRQIEKLSKPFRPPCLVHHEVESPRCLSSLDVQENVTENMKESGRVTSPATIMPNAVKEPQVVREGGGGKRRTTTQAGAQFKSPLITSSSTGTGASSQANDPAVRLTPTIQMLERKLQILKRAIRIEEDDQENILRGLISKWTEVGREIAWEVWAGVKDNNTGEEFPVTTGKRSLQHSWHWEMGDDKRPKGENKNSGGLSEMADNELEGTDNMERVDLMEELVEEEDPGRLHHTLGTMLRQLGIDPQTLGWDDEEETFKNSSGEI
ncbi:hypothetical protein D9756_000834 [Leucocoprinus leucothites]|uniref:Uncharacterized protein n=1 Tax=Leucocoprinus leucothites TaxID=201217 RepID=A0A8H5LMV3_9AGAR|nr:hypothetical protein D9756_000834 [Leucoagaricus leucothites]